MSYLRRLLRFCEGFFLGSRRHFLQRSVQASDSIARFLTSKSHFSKQRCAVKPAAFLPPSNLRLSVFNVSDLDESDIWAIGREHVTGPRKRTLYGYGALKASSVFRVKLEIQADDTPPRHAEVCGWPTEKSEQKLLALQLAQDAELKLPPAG